MKKSLHVSALVCLGVLTLVATQGAYAQSDSVTNSVAVTVDGSGDVRLFDFSGSTIPAGNVITSVTFSLTFSKLPETSGENPFYNEISFTLFDPSGTQPSILIDFDSFDIGAVDALFNGTILFADSAAQPVNADPTQPAGGTFQPISPLSIFNGTTFVAGNWTLSVEDGGVGAPLTFSSGTLTLNTAVPEPATSALLAGALLLGGAAAWRRRVRISPPTS